MPPTPTGSSPAASPNILDDAIDPADLVDHAVRDSTQQRCGSVAQRAVCHRESLRVWPVPSHLGGIGGTPLTPAGSIPDFWIAPVAWLEERNVINRFASSTFFEPLTTAAVNTWTN